MSLPISASSIPAQAFRFLQMAPLSSFADGSPEAAAAAAVYPEALRMVLETAEWSFAARVATLTEAQLLETDQPDPALPHVYILPADCVALRHVDGLQVSWRLDMTYLRCSQPDTVQIRYTALIQNEARMPATVRTAVALQMAVLLAPQYLQTRTKQVDLEARLQDAVRLALRQDGRMASPQSAYDDGAGWWDQEAVR